MPHLMITCPYHEDKHPSCSVDPDRGVWNCKSCHRSGLTYDLVRDLGVTQSEAFDREIVRKVLEARADTTHTYQAFGLPTYVVHDPGQVERMWPAVKPAQFGIGYALTRATAKTLAAFGVDYVSGLLLFRRRAAPEFWMREVGQVRECYPDGHYFSIGQLDDGLRLRFMPHERGPQEMSALIMVEGPFDALAVVEAITVEYLVAQKVMVGVCGGSVVPETPWKHPTRIYSMFDNDAAGQTMRDLAPWALPIAYDGEDPGAVAPDELRKDILCQLEEG